MYCETLPGGMRNFVTGFSSRTPGHRSRHRRRHRSNVSRLVATLLVAPKTFRRVAPKLFAWSLPPKNRLDARWGAADGPRIQVAFPKNRLDASGWAAGGPRIAFLPPKLFTWSQPYRKNRLDASGGAADGPRIAFPEYSSTGFYSSTRVFEYSSTEAGRVATQTRRIAREPIRQYM